MKFLCPQCKAKYQIADDKIEGRTLRMKCRRCEHEIVVKGDLAVAESEPPPPSDPRPAAGRAPAARPGAGPSVGARKPAGAALGAPAAPAARAPAARGAGSALGADFRRQMSAGAAEPARPSGATPLDAWHVAIHEVPVGPMKREELARKIASGAVTGESLCWREGFDDWRPLRDVAELSPLLRRTNPPPAARPAAPAAPTRPAPTAGRAVPAARPGAAPARTQSSGSVPRQGAAPAGRAAAAPAARSNVVPIGGRLGAAAAPAFDEQSDEDFDEATMVAQSPLEAAERARASAPDPAALGALVAPSAPPAAAAPAFEPPSAPEPVLAAPQPSYSEPPYEKERRRRKAAISPFALIAAAGAAAFGVALAVLVAKNLVQPPVAPAAVAAVVPPSAPMPVAPTQGAPQAPIEIPEEAAPTPAAPTPGTPATPAIRGPVKRGPGAGPAAPGQRQLTAAEQAEIARMSEGGSSGPNLVAPTRPAGQGDGPSAQAAELTGPQLAAVVNRNRPQLQHCYELAARQTGSTETMRANVEISVGGSGVVTRVSVTGPNAPVQLTNCLEGAVRRWHFPGGGQAVFPVVFSPGG